MIESEEKYKNIVLNKNYEGSLLNVCSDKLLARIKEIPQNILEQGERHLRETAKPTKIDMMIRVNLWKEYERAIKSGTKMNTTKVYAGVCDSANFYNRIIKNPRKLAWIITPIPSYASTINYLFMKSLERLEEIISLPLKDSRNKLQAPIVNKVYDAAVDIINRVAGTPVQRTANYSQVTNNTPNSPKTIKDIDAEIKQLEQKLDERKNGNRDSNRNE